VAELEHGFRSAEILQAVRPEGLDARERRQVISAEVVRRLGEERLAAVTRREEARDPVERRAEIVAVAQFDRARMQRHAHAEFCRFRPGLAVKRALCLERRCYSIGRRVKRRAEGIAARLEDVAAVTFDAVPQQCVVASERRAHRRRVRFPQPRAALDVGQQQRDGASRKICHRGVAAGPKEAEPANDTRCSFTQTL